MNELYAGFSRVDITPELGIELYGYYESRPSDGVLDPLEFNVLALATRDKKVLLIGADHCGITGDIIADLRMQISKSTDVQEDCIFIHATHIHTGPCLVNYDAPPATFKNLIPANFDDEQKKLQQDYYSLFSKRIVEAAKIAIEDLKPAKMEYGVGHAPGIGFIRRYRMKDGSVKTNPGVNNPEIKEPLGVVDDQICVLRFERTDGDSILLMSYGNHPDVIGGNKISADWPGHTRRILERTLPNTKCVFLNGTMGDVNHINVNAQPDEPNGGYEHSAHMGQVVADGVIQALEHMKHQDTTCLNSICKVISVPSNMPDASDIARAHHINDLHQSGQDNKIPFEGMQKVTLIAEASRMIRLESGPKAFDMNLSIVTIGDVAILGIPGQLFSCSGLELKSISGWDLILPTSQSNGAEGYFPSLSSYNEGGYEAVSSNFKAGVAELIVKEVKNLLSEIDNV